MMCDNQPGFLKYLNIFLKKKFHILYFYSFQVNMNSDQPKEKNNRTKKLYSLCFDPVRNGAGTAFN